ncbi:MAG: hypothetical protein WCJ14_14080 [Verrucomicrobiota bacterium]
MAEGIAHSVRSRSTAPPKAVWDLKFGESWEAQFNHLAQHAQVDQSSPVGFKSHRLGTFGVQIEKPAPRIGKDGHPVVTGSSSQE